MSAIGRIFIVLNLVLAAGFLGFVSQAASSAEDLKQQLADEQAKYAADMAAKDAEISDFRTKLSSFEDSNRTYRSERDNLEGDVTRLEGELADAKRKNSDLEGTLSEISAKLSDYNSLIESTTAQKDAAVQRAHDAEMARDDAQEAAQAAELARRDAEQAKNTAMTQIMDLQGENQDLVAQVESLDAQLTTLTAITGVDRGMVAATPKIDAAVLEARMDMGLVMLNVGRDQEVKPGYTFHIYRGGQYKGEVQVQNVEANYCSALVKGVKDGSTIAQGDRASTVL